MTIPASEALQQFPEEIVSEYERLNQRIKAEIAALEGSTTLHEMLMERFTFLYVALRNYEQTWQSLDAQRYNQAFAIWTKLAKDVVTAYKELYNKGAVNELFVVKVMTAVAEEIPDVDTLNRIRRRLAVAMKEHNVGTK